LGPQIIATTVIRGFFVAQSLGLRVGDLSSSVQLIRVCAIFAHV
jgi:hypothetical protein